MPKKLADARLRLFNIPKKSYFLFGPRGAGKSTWLKMAYPDGLIIDLLDPDICRQFQAYPERLKERVLGTPNRPIVIDEIQKSPELLSVVHSLIEDGIGPFVLTGSSARKLKRTGVDLLAGRAQLFRMHPFVASELLKFDLEFHLKYGMIPLIVSSPDPLNDLRTYLALYMKEEVMLEGLVRRVEPFARFLEAVSFSQGSPINASEIARECHISSKTVESYIGILEDLLLCFRVPIFSKRAKRILTAQAKFYYFDAGVYRQIRPKGPLDRPEEIDGIGLETLVAQHLRAWIDYANRGDELFFWRTKSGLEVDFVVYGESGIRAIEVKNSATIRPSDLRGLTEFLKDYPMAETMIVYRGRDVLQRGPITIIPANQFFLDEPYFELIRPG
ncbi:ATP-binding protein [bacterium]|nr:ATP-binding protein [bacterium]